MLMNVMYVYPASASAGAAVALTKQRCLPVALVPGLMV